MENKIVLYNNLFEIFLTKLPPQDLLIRYFNSYRDDNDELYDDDSHSLMQEFVINNTKPSIYWTTSTYSLISLN